MEPGIYLDLSEEAYHGLDINIVSNSYLSRIDKCPAKARVPIDDSPTLQIGRATHSYVLEGPAAFDERFIVAPEVDRRTKAGKEAWKEFIETCNGRTPVTTADFIKIYGMNEAVRAHPFAAELLAEGMAETTAIWKDNRTGITCKCRPDWLPSCGGIIVDLKTTQDAGEYAFGKSVSTYRYFQQASFYGKGYSIASGERIDSFVFIAVEKEFPYRVEVYAMDPDYKEWGDCEVSRLLTLEEDCRRRGHYPHYTHAGCADIMKPKYINT